MGKLKVIKTRNVKFNEEEMYFASNQANDIAGPSEDYNAEGDHNQDNATKGVYNNGQPSNPCLDTLDEPSTSWKPRKSRTKEDISFSTEIEETMDMKQDIPNWIHETV